MVEYQLSLQCQQLEAEVDADIESYRKITNDLDDIDGLNIDILETEVIPNFLADDFDLPAKIKPAPLKQTALDYFIDDYKQRHQTYVELKAHYRIILGEKDRLRREYQKEIKTAQKYATKQVKKEKKQLQKLQKIMYKENLCDEKNLLETKLTELSQVERHHFLNQLIKEHPAYWEEFYDCKKVRDVYQKIILDELPLNSQEREVLGPCLLKEDDLETIVNKKLGKNTGDSFYLSGFIPLSIVSSLIASGFVFLPLIKSGIVTNPELVIPLFFGFLVGVPTGATYLHYRTTHPQYQIKKKAKKDLKLLREETLQNLIKTR